MDDPGAYRTKHFGARRITLCIGLIALSGGFLVFRLLIHPEFGRVYVTETSESYRDTQSRLEKAESTIRKWLKLPQRPAPPQFGIQVGPALLGWSSRRSFPPQRDGHIYMEHPRHGTNKAQWEVALSNRRDLSEVRTTDLKCEFYGKNDPRGSSVFGTNWGGHSLRCIPEGQVFFARLRTNRSVVYAIQIDQQKGSSDGNRGAMRAKYVIASAPVGL